MSFHFYTERRLVELTGRKACTLEQLLGHLREVSGASIFYHTHHQYLAHHFEKPLFSNDFSHWVSAALQEAALGEKLAAIDLLSFTSIRQLREEIIRRIEENQDSKTRECPPGAEFHFAKSKSFIMPTGMVAEDLGGFIEKLPHVSTACLYFHFFEARLRLERPTNDFSLWLAGAGHTELAQAIDGLNPYLMTLEELRAAILDLAKERLAA